MRGALYDFSGDPLPFSHSVVETVHGALANSWQDSTKSTYGSGLLIFHVFCDKHNIPEHQRAPCSRDLLAAFISSLAGLYSGCTLRNYVAGIRAWHVLHRLPWKVDDIEQSRLLASADKATPASSKRPPRQPFTPAYLSAIRDQLDLTAPLDAAVFACLTTTFYCCARLGEFTVPSRNGFKPDEHVKRSNKREEEDRNGNKVTVLFLPRTKTSVNGEDVFFARQDGPTDPLTALENHLAINVGPSDAPLFAYKGRGDDLVPLSRMDFLRRLEKAAADAHLDPLQGHGIRIGATLEYLLRGLSFETVKQLGRWRSDAFSGYLRKHAKILAPFLQAVPVLLRSVQQLLAQR